MKSVLDVLRSDINRMEREISQKQLKIDKLKEMIVHYRDLSRDAQGQNRQTERAPNTERKVSAVKNEIVNLLKNGPKHRKEILNALAEKQLLNNTDSDLDYLSSRLSMWKDTMSDGKGNWYLRT